MTLAESQMLARHGSEDILQRHRRQCGRARACEMDASGEIDAGRWGSQHRFVMASLHPYVTYAR